MLKKFIILFFFLPSISYAFQCNFPIYWPLDGTKFTQKEWDESIREAKNYLRSSGITNTQIIQMLRDEMSNFKPGNSAYDNMIKEANSLCNQVGPKEYNSMLKCIEKLTNKAVKDLGLNLPRSMITNSFDLLPACTTNINSNSNSSKKQNFEDFCKNTTLESIDEDVALLCLEKLKN